MIVSVRWVYNTHDDDSAKHTSVRPSRFWAERIFMIAIVALSSILTCKEPLCRTPGPGVCLYSYVWVCVTSGIFVSSADSASIPTAYFLLLEQDVRSSVWLLLGRRKYEGRNDRSDQSVLPQVLCRTVRCLVDAPSISYLRCTVFCRRSFVASH